jgi:hypothetical protein
MQTEQDPQLTYVINEARGIMDLDQAIRETLAAGDKLVSNAEAYALSNASVEDLLKMEKTEGVYRAILTRENVPSKRFRQLSGLAKLRNVAEIEELFTLIEELNAKASVNVLNSANVLSQLLSSQPADQLAKVRDRIATLATTAKSGETRRVAIAAWISADNNGDAVFAAVEKEQLKLEDVCEQSRCHPRKRRVHSVWIPGEVRHWPDLEGASSNAADTTSESTSMLQVPATWLVKHCRP